MGGLFDGVNPAVVWGILAVVLAAAEIVVPGVFLIWLAVAAGLTAGLTLLLPIGEPFQLLAFAILSVLSMFGGRLWYLGRPVEPEDPLLNDRMARMMGRTAVVIEPISHGEGRVRIDDGSWLATGPDAPAGTHVRIAGFSGARLEVELMQIEAG